MKIIHLAAFLAGCFFIQSCVKNVPNPITDAGSTQNIIEFGDTGPIASPSGSVYALYEPIIGTIQNDTTGFYINVSYSGADNAPENITVKLAVDSSAVAKYNTEQDTHYKILPEGTYEFPASLEFQKGFNGAVHLRGIIKKVSTLSKGVTYVLPMKIASASSGIVSANFGTVLYSFTFE